MVIPEVGVQTRPPATHTVRAAWTFDRVLFKKKSAAYLVKRVPECLNHVLNLSQALKVWKRLDCQFYYTCISGFRGSFAQV